MLSLIKENQIGIMNKFIFIIFFSLLFTQKNITTKEFSFFYDGINNIIDTNKLVKDYNGIYHFKIISINDVSFERTKKILIEQCDLEFNISNNVSSIEVSRCAGELSFNGTLFIDANNQDIIIKHPKYKHLNFTLTYWLSGNFEDNNNINLKNDGILNEYYDDGSLRIHFNFENGKKHGIQKKWYKNGQLEILYNYDNGKLQGLQKKWFSNGFLRGQWSYDNDKLHGIAKEWYNNGNLKFSKKYENGTLIELLENNDIDGSSF